MAAARPVGGQGLAAGLAAQEPAQRELVAQLHLRRGRAAAGEALLHGGEGRRVDDPLVLALDLETVLLGADPANVERVGEGLPQLLHADLEAVLRAQAAAGDGGEGVGDHLAARHRLERRAHERRLRRVGLDPLARAVFGLPVDVAERRRVRPAALALSRQHAVANLLGVELDQELVRGAEEVLHRAAVGVFGDRHQHRVDPGAERGELLLELPLLLEVAKEPRQVVDHEDVDRPAGLLLGGDERQRLGERRALRRAPALALFAEAAHQVDALAAEPLHPVRHLLVKARAGDLRGVGDPGVVDAAEGHRHPPTSSSRSPPGSIMSASAARCPSSSTRMSFAAISSRLPGAVSAGRSATGRPG